MKFVTKLKSLTAAIALLAGVGFAANAFASTTPALVSHDEFSVGKGDLNLDFSIEPVIITGDLEDETFDFIAGANYFITDIFAPGFEFQIQHMATTNVRLFPNLKAYWPTGTRILPYAQVGIGYARYLRQNEFDFGLGGGVDFLLSSSVGIGIQFKYDLFVGDATAHLLQFPIDFAIYFHI